MCGGGNDGYADSAIEELHPLGDLRLVRFLLSVPAIPWCREKHVIRIVLKGILPEAVRQRRKAPLAGFPYFEQARHFTPAELPPVQSLERYVDLSKLPDWPGENREELDYAVRVLSLHYWLLSL
jgi:asparagine synthase (glutamine-hydrolysing)